MDNIAKIILGLLIGIPVIIIFTLLVVFTKDHEYRCEFMVINFTDSSFVNFHSFSDTMGMNSDSANTTFLRTFDNDKKRICLVHDFYLSGRSYRRYRCPEGIDDDMFFSQSHDRKMRFYIIKASVFMNNPWDTIVKYQMYHKKLTFTKENMDSTGWDVKIK